MKSLAKIKVILQQQKDKLEQEFLVKSIALFGSYVRGEQKVSSDIDLLVEFAIPVSLLHILTLENYLSDLLGINVDVVLKKNLREELKRDILREAIPI